MYDPKRRLRVEKLAAVLGKRSDHTNQHEKRNRRNEEKTATIVDQAYARKEQATHPARVPYITLSLVRKNAKFWG